MTKKACNDCGAEHRSTKSKLYCRIKHGKGPKRGDGKNRELQNINQNAIIDQHLRPHVAISYKEHVQNEKSWVQQLAITRANAQIKFNNCVMRIRNLGSTQDKQKLNERQIARIKKQSGRWANLIWETDRQIQEVWSVIRDLYIKYLLTKSVLEQGATNDFQKIQQRVINIRGQADRDLGQFQHQFQNWANRGLQTSPRDQLSAFLAQFKQKNLPSRMQNASFAQYMVNEKKTNEWVNQNIRRTHMRLFPPLRVLHKAFNEFARIRFREKYTGKTLPYFYRQHILDFYNKYCEAANYFRSQFYFPQRHSPQLKAALQVLRVHFNNNMPTPRPLLPIQFKQPKKKHLRNEPQPIQQIPIESEGDLIFIINKLAGNDVIQQMNPQQTGDLLEKINYNVIIYPIDYIVEELEQNTVYIKYSRLFKPQWVKLTPILCDKEGFLSIRGYKLFLVDKK